MGLYYKLEKPDLSKINFNSIIDVISKNGDTSFYLSKAMGSPYLHWDKLQFAEIPTYISSKEYWFLVKLLRKSSMEGTLVKSEDGAYFRYIKQTNLEEALNKIDMKTGGSKMIESRVKDEKLNQIFIRRGLVEEAIASSQLEGAHTTRKVAKRMLLEGTKPRNKSDQMILNNYEAIKAVGSDYKDRDLDLGMLNELHKMISKDTLDDPKDEGRMRKGKEIVYVKDRVTGKIYHTSPKASFVKKELVNLIDFANDKSKSKFIHPVLKAIMIHFWIGYLHPFNDGNGRLARLLFYWYLIKKDYWAFAYVPISKMIKNSPKQYGMSYVYSEQDDNDLTYFIDYNINKIELAITAFVKYMDKKAYENKSMNENSKSKYGFNDRQIMLLQYLNGDESGKTTIRSHAELHQITRKTAIKDLKGLLESGFLKFERISRKLYYYSTDNISKLFND